jgi:hypothetical protein
MKRPWLPPLWTSNSMAAEPRVWCAMIYVADIRDVAGAVRRSKRLHWQQEGARREVEGWVTEMRLSPVRWEIADDETLVGRIPGYFVVVSSLLLPKKGERLTP